MVEVQLIFHVNTLKCLIKRWRTHGSGVLEETAHSNCLPTLVHVFAFVVKASASSRPNPKESLTRETRQKQIE